MQDVQSQPSNPVSLPEAEFQTRTHEVLELVVGERQVVSILRECRTIAFLVDAARYSDLVEKAERLDRLLDLVDDAESLKVLAKIDIDTLHENSISMKDMMEQLDLSEADLEAVPDEPF